VLSEKCKVPSEKWVSRTEKCSGVVAKWEGGDEKRDVPTEKCLSGTEKCFGKIFQAVFIINKYLF
jgi:hypothetical protein